ncbi:MAG: response regulator, partial [Candidatus Omnitrophica bacterium]|nr:response regulator [Candidatus Omnitrophota bacterium]
MAKILCIDSNPDFLEQIENLLKHEGYHVETALIGASGFNKFRSFSPDLVLLNLNLSDMKGLDLLDKLHAENAKVPVAVFTGYGCEDEVVVEAHSRGAAEFILKTVPTSTLSLRIKTMLRKYQAIRTKEKLATPSVMVIDDNVDLCNLIRFSLEKSGYNVYVISDSTKAME